MRVREKKKKNNIKKYKDMKDRSERKFKNKDSRKSVKI